ncbi:sensor domain-containing diguanylate cyclase [Pelomonas sp. SE-A7]|uniref:sensor domain-containing diguanylate cyclase n=1 Tax=Pelomonas sp. SE-A7 TaxID=3054953 RepID=UPI00259CF3FC|nr:sensor domain-containing diguanylate cyclase [Pelomonas sp. SE-A7]MDM4768221.1 diguanylate cyclase [Pelomonas sp. SE-A7]
MSESPLPQTLLALHEAGPNPAALFDVNDVLRWANKAFCEAFKVQPDGRLGWADMVRANHASGQGAVIETDDIEAWLAATGTRRGKLPYRAFESDLADGRWLWVSETLLPDGWMLLLAMDITALRQDARSLRQAHVKALRAAETDSLTGLANRRQGMKLLQQALGAADQWPLSIAMLDLDHFKQVNDQLGHAAGDQVLVDFARQLLAGTRREDGCVRLGGEEFLLILPAAALGQAGVIVERLLAKVRLSRPLAEQPEFGYRCSGGLVEARWGESAEALLKRADEALYRAKAQGRDRVERDDAPA